MDHYKQYYDRDYITKHRPILLLKFDGNLPDDWPPGENGTAFGPYCVVHESFTPVEKIYGYVEKPRSSHAVVSLELTSYNQSLGRFTPKESENNPEILKGENPEEAVVPATISIMLVGKWAPHGLSLPQRL